MALGCGASGASAQDKLVVSLWGGNWLEGIQMTVGKRFTEQTGIEIEYQTGNSTERLTQAKVAGVPSGVDVTLTTSHEVPLWVESGLLEELDMSKLPNAKDLFPEAIRSPYHLGLYSYVYTPGFRTDLLPEGFRIDSWEKLWSPELENKLGLPNFDASHIITVAAILSGGDAANWEVGIPKLLELKPNIRMLYGSDTQSQEALKNGESPVQVLLSINGFHIKEQGVPLQIEIPKEGAVVGIDSICINKGTDMLEEAHIFANIALDAQVQKELVEFYKAGPVNSKAVLDPEIAAIPGVMTTPQQWEQAILIDDKVRAQHYNEWIVWFTENMSR
jgi:putative spermidine/putrescine transport system substrate-binding protein